jgi:hypothetical protein
MLWISCGLLFGLAIAGSYWGFTAHNLWFKPLFPALLILLLAPVLQVFSLRATAIAVDRVEEPHLAAVETVAAETSDLVVGEEVTTVGRYQIEGELGQGAMGVVYKAVDPTIGRPVAIKTIRLDQTLGSKQLSNLKERSLREAQVAGQLSHPNIVTILSPSMTWWNKVAIFSSPWNLLTVKSSADFVAKTLFSSLDKPPRSLPTSAMLLIMLINNPLSIGT